MTRWQWGLAIPPTGSAKGPVQPGGMYAALTRARNRKLTFRVDPDIGHEASFDIDGTVPEASDLDEMITDVVVQRGTQWMFRGRIMPTTDTLDGSRHTLSVSVKDYRELLKHRFQVGNGTLSYTNVDQSLIAWDLVSFTQGLPGGWMGISRGVTPGGVTRSVTYVATDYIGDKITELAQMDDGFDWDLTVTGISSLQLDIWHPYRGRVTNMVLEYGSDLVAGITRSVDPSAYANDVYVTGDSTVSLTPVSAVASDIATRAEGRWDLTVGTTVKVQSALQSRANWELGNAEVITPAYQVTLRKNAWTGPAQVWVGDFVQLRIRSGRLNVDASYRVMQLDVALGDDGDESVTLTLGRIPPRIGKTISLALRRLRNLELR